MGVSSTMEETLIEKREAQIISPSTESSTSRVAHFLKPTLPLSSTHTKTLINPPPEISNPSKPISSILQSLSSNVNFHGWRNPQKKWNSWVDKLTPKFQSTWKKASIFEAIMASTLEIPKCKASIFTLAERWCSKTNSFVLPLGEVTLTLEDIMVLGGYSVTGDSVLSQISSKNDYEIEESLLRARLEIVKSKCRKASQYKWIEIWMENGSKFEHEAFLSLWLSRFVFPADSLEIINKSVFEIAIQLAKGIKIALAPAVLASIYRDMGLLNENIRNVRNLIGQNDIIVKKHNIWAPLQLLQAWIWERFPTFSPKPNSKTKGLCRLERWHRVKVDGIDDIGKSIDSAGCKFQWRPYSNPLNKLCVDYDLESYARCIRVAQLVGLDCFERYAPHRVAMQFGLDQDIPVDIACSSENRNNAWRHYNRPIGDVELYMPPKSFQPGVTSRYLAWRGKSKFEKGNVEGSIAMAEMLRIKEENDKAEIPPGFSSIGKREAVEVDGGSDEYQPCYKRSKRSGSEVVEIESSESNDSHGYLRTKQEKSEEEEEEEEEDDDDHKTLSQLFKVKRNSSDTNLLNHQDSMLSSEGDNALIQDKSLASTYTIQRMASEECTENAPSIKDRSDSNVDSLINCEVQTPFDGTNEISRIDRLAHRIVKLQKIVDLVKAAKRPKTNQI